MVNVAQSVEPRIVIPVVVGSSPIVHPNQTLDAPRLNRVELMCFTMSIGPLAQLVEQLTLNQRVLGSSPRRPTNKNRNLDIVNTDLEDGISL